MIFHIRIRKFESPHILAISYRLRKNNQRSELKWKVQLASRIPFKIFISKVKLRDWIVLILLHKRSGMTGKLYKNSLLSCRLKRIAWGSRKKHFFIQIREIVAREHGKKGRHGGSENATGTPKNDIRSICWTNMVPIWWLIRMTHMSWIIHLFHVLTRGGIYQLSRQNVKITKSYSKCQFSIR